MLGDAQNAVPRSDLPERDEGQRLVWVDACRGLAVFLVVFFHVCIWLYLPMMEKRRPEAAIAGEWEQVAAVIGSLRMPVLVAISGLLASRRVAIGFRSVARGVATNAYLYLVWLTIYALFALAMPRPLAHDIGSLKEFASQLVIPQTTLWYIFALVVFVLAMTASRRLPGWLVIALSLIISVGVRLVPFDLGMWQKILGLTIFFAVGVRGGARVQRVSGMLFRRPAVTGKIAIGTTGIFLVSIWVHRFVMGNELATALLIDFRGFIGVLVAATWAILLTKIGVVARIGGYLGRRTLGVYVLHVIVIELLISAVLWFGRRGLDPGPVIAVILPPTLAIAVTAVCLGLEVMLRRSQAAVLLRLPFPVDQWLQAHAARGRQDHSGADGHGFGLVSPVGSIEHPSRTSGAASTNQRSDTGGSQDGINSGGSAQTSAD